MNKPTDTPTRHLTKAAMAAAKEFLHPLAGDFLQESQCKELARIIDKHMGSYMHTPTTTDARPNNNAV